MTYVGFHLLFIVGPTLVLAITALRRQHHLGSRTRLALFGVAPLAILYTARWDQYLIANRVWWYGEDRVLGSWLGVPYEEYAFMALQPVLTGSLLLVIISRRSDLRLPVPSARWWVPGILTGIAVISVGVVGGVSALRAGHTWTYFGLILIWAFPALGALLAGAWKGLSFFARESLTAWSLATLYLCVADRIAIGAEVWTIGAETSTGWMLVGLPIEEALFFAVTNALVIAGAMLFFAPGLTPAKPAGSS